MKQVSKNSAAFVSDAKELDLECGDDDREAECSVGAAVITERVSARRVLVFSTFFLENKVSATVNSLSLD
jgi:hypothetical protein